MNNIKTQRDITISHKEKKPLNPLRHPMWTEFNKRKTNDPTLTKIRKWSIDRNLHNADPVKQVAKLMEECGEIASAVIKNKRVDIKDSIGDAVVVLTILAQQCELKIEDCFDKAYEVIKERKGKLVNGIFVKESDL